MKQASRAGGERIKGDFRAGVRVGVEKVGEEGGGVRSSYIGRETCHLLGNWSVALLCRVRGSGELTTFMKSKDDHLAVMAHTSSKWCGSTEQGSGLSTLLNS